MLTIPLLTAATTAAPGTSVSGISAAKTYHASGTTSSGTGAATVLVQGSHNGAAWDTIGTITLTLGTVAMGDGFSSNDRYGLLRGNVTAISGTGAAVSLTVGY